MIEQIKHSYLNYANYLWKDITLQNDGGLMHNYFWMLVLVSVFFFILEIAKPWRKNQPVFRKDFWLDFFYMFFNFFLFSLIIYAAASDVVVNFINRGVLSTTGFDLQASNPMNSWPLWAILITGFILRDFIQWWVHRLLHKVDWLWQFHKVHHSVEQMGFAAHLRYHWMENIVYRSIEYIPLALLGIGLHDFFLIHIFALVWGHYNHANFVVSGRVTGGIVAAGTAALIVYTGYPDMESLLGISIILSSAIIGVLLLSPIMKKLFNSPEMHIWHHAHDMPSSHPNGINFGLTLAIWDYIFGTAHVPHSGRDISLGFEHVEDFPHDFTHQQLFGIKTIKS